MIATTCVQCGRPGVWNPTARLVEHGADRECELPPRDVRGPRGVTPWTPTSITTDEPLRRAA